MAADVSAHAASAPQGGEVCAIKEGLAAATGGPDKPIGDTCARPLKDDQLWHRSMLVLGVYGESLDAVANGTSTDTSGQILAARTGIEGKDWSSADGAPEQAAKEAAANLVELIRTNAAKGKLDKAVKDAAPYVHTLCDGITSYLEEQGKGYGEVMKEVEKRRAQKSDRRCTTIDSKPVCVSDSSSDRIVYGHAVGQLALLEANHREAKEAVASFCAAHRALEEAAANGKLSDDATYTAVVNAVKAARKQH